MLGVLRAVAYEPKSLVFVPTGVPHCPQKASPGVMRAPHVPQKRLLPPGAGELGPTRWGASAAEGGAP